ncbi:MAG: hypothetical protein OXK82_07545 [Deltaproteobacteria bacterium]|nr:hypothetical protein [Deltaproteobacteria bacterium]
MALREFLLDPVLKWGLSVAAVVVAAGAVVLVAVQMWRGDALVCADGSIFADTCEAVTVIGSSLPDGVVVAFNSDKCPSGWREYAQAYGRFIRGIDKANSGIDPDGKREVGSIQDEQFLGHNHTRPRGVYDAGGGSDASWVDHARHLGYGHANPPKTGTTGGSETRPDNVALLYCEKI